MSIFYRIVFVFIAIAFVGCHTSKSVVRTSKGSSPKVAQHNIKQKPAGTKTPVEVKPPSEVIVSTSKTVVTSEVIKSYVNQYKDVAMNNMKTYGIPASIILAQGILESGAGKGDLALSANNHF